MHPFSYKSFVMHATATQTSLETECTQHSVYSPSIKSRKNRWTSFVTFTGSLLDAYGKWHTWEYEWLLWNSVIVGTGASAGATVYLIVDSYLVCILSNKQREKSQRVRFEGDHAAERRPPARSSRSYDVNRNSSFCFLLRQWRENVFYVWGRGRQRGVGSIAGALISAGIVRINGSYCRVCCLFP